MAKSFKNRTALAACVLTAGLGAGLLGAHDTRAAFIGCRSDPIVILSNGVVLDLSADIVDDVSDVQQVNYVLHAPKGVSLLRSISTDGPVGYREHFNFQPDSKLSGTGGTYELDMQIQGRAKNISVTATIAGGDAAALGITPDMVTPGATSFVPVDANDAKGPGPKGPKGPAALPDAPLPDTVISAIATWAQSAPWAVTASATSTAAKGLSATVTL
jgi:hypothetical protein